MEKIALVAPTPSPNDKTAAMDTRGVAARQGQDGDRPRVCWRGVGVIVDDGEVCEEPEKSGQESRHYLDLYLKLSLTSCPRQGRMASPHPPCWEICSSSGWG